MLQEMVPILRIFNEAKAKEFYVDFLDFKIDWEHRLETDSPLYMQISKNDIKLHLSEHYGDCCPGAAVRIRVDEIKAFHKELMEKQYSYARPGLEITPWGNEECCLLDPFGNRLIFYKNM